MTQLDSVVGREKLKPRRDPYFQKLEAGCFVGFRKMAAGSGGNWLARYLSDTGKQQFKALGDYDHLIPSDRFKAACKDARAWFDHLGQGGTVIAYTVKDACTRYAEHLKGRGKPGAAKDAMRRFNAYVLDDKRLSETELQKLTAARVTDWRKALSKRPTVAGSNRGALRTDSTMNRDMSALRAALNLALEDGLVTTDAAWRSKLKPIANADRQRNAYLDREQRARLLEQCSDGLETLVRALSLIPARPGAVVTLRVADFDRRLNVLCIGSDKTGPRKISLPQTTADIFALQTVDKLPTAFLFTRADGVPWNKDSWKKPIRAAVKAAGLGPDVTLYTLRHSTITDLVHSGLDLLTVAQLSGTSLKMIEQHYGHLIGSRGAQGLEVLARAPQANKGTLQGR
ncbi:MAG: tyrosine-type recombinase/integrase [Rhodoferax sp.]|nr:tyrosine-type recombinase/integrase [Rhodoferax sp.]